MDNNDPLESLAGRIHLAVERQVGRGVNREALAELLGYKSKSTLSKWASGSQVPAAENLMRLPATLGVSGHWLLTGEGPMKTEPQLDGEKLEVIQAVLSDQFDIPNLLRISRLPQPTSEDAARMAAETEAQLQRPSDQSAPRRDPDAPDEHDPSTRRTKEGP